MLRILALVVAVEAALETATLPTSILRPSTENVSDVFHNNTSPDNITITADSRSLLVDGRRWFPVDGELHFTRVPRSMWREELRRVKAGGLDQVATYVFWNHHEELRGDYDFSGRRDLRAFLETARDVGLKVLLRLGPFGAVVVDVDLPALDPSPRPVVRLVKPFATPVREIPVVKSSGKPREPDLGDWLGAAEYEINVTLPPGAEWRLRVDYAGDAARVLFEDRLLTDNWYTGYETSGGLEVGLTFLADENPGLLGGTTTLRLLVLPLQKKALEDNVFLDEKLWPAFDLANGSLALELKGVEVLAVRPASVNL